MIIALQLPWLWKKGLHYSLNFGTCIINIGKLRYYCYSRSSIEEQNWVILKKHIDHWRSLKITQRKDVTTTKLHHKVLKNNERRRSNLNLTPHTTVFHQFPLSNDCSWSQGIICIVFQVNSFDVFLFVLNLLFFKQQQRPPQHHPSIIELPQCSRPAPQCPHLLHFQCLSS